MLGISAPPAQAIPLATCWVLQPPAPQCAPERGKMGRLEVLFQVLSSQEGALLSPNVNAAPVGCAGAASACAFPMAPARARELVGVGKHSWTEGESAWMMPAASGLGGWPCRSGLCKYIVNNCLIKVQNCI